MDKWLGGNGSRKWGRRQIRTIKPYSSDMPGLQCTTPFISSQFVETLHKNRDSLLNQRLRLHQPPSACIHQYHSLFHQWKRLFVQNMPRTLHQRAMQTDDIRRSEERRVGKECRSRW